MMTSKKSKSVLIIAGETSGDVHGAGLVKEMKKLDDAISFCGIGGVRLRNEGVRILVDASELSMMGIIEVFSIFPAALKSYSCVKNILRNERPDLVILIDFPEFNLVVAKIAKKFNIPVLYYISPQIWAWRSGRIRRIKRDVDHVAVILPFEKDYYSAHSVPATFVGHPLMDHYASIPAKKYQYTPGKNPVIGLLPGSRRSEIERNLPEMLAAASQLQQRYKNMEFAVSLAPSISREWVETYIHPYRQTCRMDLMDGNILEILDKSDLVVAASGTVTLESAIYGVPMVIVYRISPVSYMFGKSLVRVDHIGLVNIIANERVVPELIQNDATPSNIAQTVSRMIDSPEELEKICGKLQTVRQRLGNAGAAAKAAEVALFLLRQHEFCEPLIP
jgi:lipid-A-disaccharide synthase